MWFLRSLILAYEPLVDDPVSCAWLLHGITTEVAGQFQQGSYVQVLAVVVG